MKEESILAKCASEMAETVERMVVQIGLADVHCDRLFPPSSAWRTPWRGRREERRVSGPPAPSFGDLEDGGRGTMKNSGLVYDHNSGRQKPCGWTCWRLVLGMGMLTS